MAITAKCPHCGVKERLKPDVFGKTNLCIACGKSYRAPSLNKESPKEPAKKSFAPNEQEILEIKECPGCHIMVRATSAKCGFCGNGFTFQESSNTKSVQAQADNSPLKACPFCKEDIKSEAIKCRFCGEVLQKNPAPIPQRTQEEVPKFQCNNCGGTYHWDEAFEIPKGVGYSSGNWSGSSTGWISGPSYTSMGGSQSQIHYSLVKICPACYRIWLAREQKKAREKARNFIEVMAMIFVPLFFGYIFESWKVGIYLFLFIFVGSLVGKLAFPTK